MVFKISRSFKDISLSFSRHPVTNDILSIKNEDAIKKSVVNLVRTNIGERFFNRLLGTRINESLFELHTQELTILLEEEIRTLMTNNEPRIRVDSIIIDPNYDSNDLYIKMSYDIIGQGIPRQNIEFILQPTRA